MKDKFDKILSDKIKEVAENRDIPYNPEHWKMLVAKKKKDKRRIFFYWRIAAFFMLSLIAGGLGKYFFSTSDSNDAINPQIILDNKNDSLRIDSLKLNEKIFITSGPDYIDSLNQSDSNVSLIDSTTINNKSKFNNSNDFNVKEAVASTEINNKKQPIKNKNVIPPAIDKIEILTDSLKGNTTIANKDIKSKNENLAFSIDKEKNIDSIISKKNLAEIDQKIKNDSLTIKKEVMALVKEEKSEDKKIRKPIKYGVDISPILDYNQEGENSNIGFAGGVTVEIPISKKFNIGTGIIYADQKLNLNEQTSYLSDVVSSKSASQLVNKEAVIKGIEIPVNLKYNFSFNEKNLFISAGFSSTSYFKEDVEASYLVNNRTEIATQDTFGNNIVKYELVQTDSKVVTPSNSNSFNFANILNLSFGIELPINNQLQSVIIEPYFKYSLTPVTQQKVDFSSLGIHLRYNFSFQRK